MTNDIERAADEVTAKLRGRGVRVADTDSPEDLVMMLEAVEGFEHIVIRRGGDLMVDEPPEGSTPQPDDERFLLPKRGEGEAGPDYAARLQNAGQKIGR